MIIQLFYRDGDNYKDIWEQEIENSIWEDFLKTEELELDPDLKSENLYEIQNLGLTMYDIPMIKEHGISNMDHNLISIVKIIGDK